MPFSSRRKDGVPTDVHRASMAASGIWSGLGWPGAATIKGKGIGMSFQMDLLIHAANVLYLFAFTVRDILWLRTLAVVAAACLIPYFYFRPEPLMTPIYWNLVFTALNVYWVCRLLLERLPVKLSADEQRLCELVFRTMTPREMIKLLKLAT